MPGTRVAIEAVTGCGTCFHCVRGSYNLCQDWHHLGLTIPGALAELVVVPATSLFPLPDAIGFDNAAILEPLATVVNTLERSRPLPGTSVATLGPGPFELLHVQALRRGRWSDRRFRPSRRRGATRAGASRGRRRGESGRSRRRT